MVRNTWLKLAFGGAALIGGGIGVAHLVQRRRRSVAEDAVPSRWLKRQSQANRAMHFHNRSASPRSGSNEAASP